ELSELDTPLSISQISDELDKSKSTVARHVNSLESENLVTTAKEGRTKSVTLSDSGRVFLKGRRPQVS
ncbi:ArsR family transcriptional regulator, partial [Halorubrum sp. Atlit-9R]